MAKIKLDGKYYYQIEEEDDYFKIGKKLYGQYSAAPLIAQANPDFEFLKTGAVIDLPEEVPEKIMIPYKKQNKDAAVREKHLDRETSIEEMPEDLDDPISSLSDADEQIEEYGPEDMQTKEFALGENPKVNNPSDRLQPMEDYPYRLVESSLILSIGGTACFEDFSI